MQVRQAQLEYWMREFYFTTTLDLGSSGVPCWSLGELRELLGISFDDLDRILMDDADTYGSPGLRDAVARRFVHGDSDRVMTTHGSSEAIFLAMNALLSPGDEVVHVAPGYHSFTSIAAAIGCKLTPWELRAEEDFIPNLDDLRTLVTSQTKMVVVNFPHNPTGASLTHAQLDELLEIVDSAGALLLWDGALAELVYDTRQLPDPATLYDRCLSTGTMSKAYGLPGTRIGWCLGHPDLLRTFLPLRDAAAICLPPLTQFLAERAIAEADLLVKPRREQARSNRTTLMDWAATNADRVKCAEPVGGCTAFPSFAGIADTDALCRQLATEDGVLVVPGSCFGQPDRVRLGFGGASDEFEDGLGRLDRVLGSIER